MTSINDICLLPGVRAVTTDSRKVTSASIFVAVKGSVFDGHSVIADAVQRGALAIVVERMPEEVPPVPMAVVADSRLAFAQCVQHVFGNPAEKLAVYGVTGTNGKTTCATIMEQLFLAAQRRTGFVGTTGNRYGGRTHATEYTTPHADILASLFTEMVDHGINTVCMEVSSHALEQHRVWGVPFRGALFTNLTRDHLDYHGTMERYAASKKRLFDSLQPNAFAVLNGDCEWTPYMKRNCAAGTIVTVGVDAGNRVRVVDRKMGLDKTTFTLQVNHPWQEGFPREIPIETQLVGDFNVVNAALCVVAAMVDGTEPDLAVQHMRSVKGPAGRMERYMLPNGAVAVVDYAHTPDALSSALRVLRMLRPHGSRDHRIHVVFGCGGDRDKGKRPEMGRIAAELADAVWITSDNPRTEGPEDIIRHIMSGIEGAARERVEIVLDRRQAIRDALGNAGPQDVVLIAGKGHEEYQIVGTERLPFSDAAEVLAWKPG